MSAFPKLKEEASPREVSLFYFFVMDSGVGWMGRKII